METSLKIANSYQINLVLAAYSADHKGHIFNFPVIYLPAKENIVHAECELGNALLLELLRILNILYRVKASWNMIKGSFVLNVSYHDILSGDISSSGLGIAIGLFNLARKINGSKIISHITGTGNIRANGLVEGAAGVEIKKSALKKVFSDEIILLTADEIPNLHKLDQNLIKFF